MDALFFRLGRDGAVISAVITEESDTGWFWTAWRSDGAGYAWNPYQSVEECDATINEQVTSMVGRGWRLIEGPRAVVVPEPPAIGDDEAGDVWCRGLWTVAERG